MKPSSLLFAMGVLSFGCGVSDSETGGPPPSTAAATTTTGGTTATSSTSAGPTTSGATSSSAASGASGGSGGSVSVGATGGSGGAATAGSAGSAGSGGAATAGSAGSAGSGGAGGTAGSGGSATDAGTTDAGACPPLPACNAAFPDVGAARAWKHSAPFGLANHRGRDLFLTPGAPQWIIGNFQYGLALLEGPLRDEEIDIYLNRGCGTDWEKLGTAATTDTPSRPKTEGVEDASGRLFFEIPAAKALGLGRHRVRLVVGGDLSAVDMFIEVVPPSTPVFVTDVDGTLTNSENAQTLAILTGTMPEPNPDAALALSALASRGYRPFYLSARPEWLVKTTQEWIVAKGFPPGILHTTLVAGGATGDAATTFKTDELSDLAAKPIKAVFAIGNTDSDANAYNNAAIQPLSNRIFFQYTDTAWNGRRIEAYGPLVAEFGALPPVCP